MSWIRPVAWPAAALAVLVAAAPPAPAPPVSALVRGVPYVAWREAAAVPYPRNDIMNPSWMAACAMVTGYWDPAMTLATPGKAVIERCFDEKTLRTAEGATTAQLQEALAAGRPVMLALALTPDGHPLYAAFAMSRALGMVKAEWPTGASSGVMGEVMPLEAIPAFKEGMSGTNPIRESMVSAVRVAVGYDAERGVVTLHDPSFGPAVEVPLAEFERMWTAADRRMLVVEPGNADAVLRERATAPEYRALTDDEVAARHWVHGYVRSALLRLEDGERDFRAGLTLPGVGTGYRHLLLLELGMTLGGLGRDAEGIEALQQATALVPEHPRAWKALAELARHAGRTDVADEAAKRAKKADDALKRDAATRARLAAAIPADLWLPTLGPLRGWGGARALTP